MDFMNAARNLLAIAPAAPAPAAPAPAAPALAAPAPADPAPTYGYGDSQVGYRPYFGESPAGPDLQSLAGDPGGFAEGFAAGQLLVADWDGGAYGAPAPASELEKDVWGTPAPAGGAEQAYPAYGTSTTDLGYLMQNVATVATDAPAPAFDNKLNWGWS
ncbi:MAG: hypothetical protein JO339_39065 [Alphaproteobacteria bacterium]|nr:hypothetical protein [Alphaproteobacteria bacterium]